MSKQNKQHLFQTIYINLQHLDHLKRWRDEVLPFLRKISESKVIHHDLNTTIDCSFLKNLTVNCKRSESIEEIHKLGEKFIIWMEDNLYKHSNNKELLICLDNHYAFNVKDTLSFTFMYNKYYNTIHTLKALIEYLRENKDNIITLMSEDDKSADYLLILKDKSFLLDSSLVTEYPQQQKWSHLIYLLTFFRLYKENLQRKRN
jgi:hypothetical protein